MLAECPSCSGFLPPSASDCPHCEWSGATAKRRGRLARVLVQLLGGSSLTVTLMACYGAPYQDDGGWYETDAAIDCEVGKTYQNGMCVPIPCGTDEQCPEAEGFVCDIQAYQCIPNPLCTSDASCGQGESCDLESGECQPGCDPRDVVCDLAMPICPAGYIAAIEDGCWSGVCIATETCTPPSGCALHESEESCTTDTACEAIFRGVDCTSPDGSACSDSPDCTCESFVFDSCDEKEPVPSPAPA